MDPIHKRTGTTSACVAVNCCMRGGTNLLSNIKMIRFPSNLERKKMWEAAVKREGWTSTKASRLCSKHFVTGAPSTNPLHVDYVPSIFAHNDNAVLSSAKLQKYERNQSKGKIEEIPRPMHVLEEKKFADVSTLTDLTMKDINKLEQTEKASASVCSVYRDSLAQTSTFQMIMSSEPKCNFYTKLSTVAFFWQLLELLLSNWNPSIKTRLQPKEQLLLVLMKLRLGLIDKDLGYRFYVNSSTVGRIFRLWMKRMSQVLCRFINWPSKITAAKHLPECFRHDILKNVICILDCSEIFIDTPFNLDGRAQTYSNYKNHNTVKFLLAISPSGAITFISQLYGGRHSDKSITAQCGILDKLKFGDSVLADRGFHIEDLVGVKGATLILPSFTRGKTQLSKDDLSRSRLISKGRVHIERAIRRIKSYRILKYQWPVHFVSSDDNGSSLGNDILVTLCALCNICKPPLL